MLPFGVWQFFSSWMMFLPYISPYESTIAFQDPVLTMPLPQGHRLTLYQRGKNLFLFGTPEILYLHLFYSIYCLLLHVAYNLFYYILSSDYIFSVFMFPMDSTRNFVEWMNGCPEAPWTDQYLVKSMECQNFRHHIIQAYGEGQVFCGSRDLFRTTQNSPQKTIPNLQTYWTSCSHLSCLLFPLFLGNHFFTLWQLDIQGFLS